MRGFSEREIAGEPSWVLASDCVEMALTQRGAQMAPVTFGYADTPVEPYYVSPWQGEGLDLRTFWSEVALRGDFFCMPFGNGQYKRDDGRPGEQHPSHGEAAGAVWSLVDVRETAGVQTLAVELQTHVRPGRIQRALSLVAGHDVVYSSTVIDGFSGPVTMAHHAMLRAPAPERPLLLSNNGFQFGSVCPHPFGDPAAGEYQSLRVGAEFTSLERVPSAFHHLGDQDCSHWPVRPGYSDFLQVANVVPASGEPAWTAAVNAAEGYVWFALKDVRVLPSTLLWMENRGRHAAPWLGRNCALGIEDACTFYGTGIAESKAPNSFSERGIATHHELGGAPFTVPYIQGIARCPASFMRVASASFEAGGVTFTDEAGASVSAAVQWDFVFGAELRSS